MPFRHLFRDDQCQKKETLLVRRKGLDYKVMKFTYRLSLSYHARSLAANYSILLVNANYKIYEISSEKKKNTPVARMEHAGQGSRGLPRRGRARLASKSLKKI